MVRSAKGRRPVVCDGATRLSGPLATLLARARMPLGSQHDETGLLVREGYWLVLQRDEGGRWRLDANRKAERMLGQRVRIVGIRSSFDLLDVTRIEPA